MRYVLHQRWPVAIVALMLALAASAQEPFRCGTDLMRQRAIAADPHILDLEMQLEEFTRDWIAEHRAQRVDDSTVFIIPVVFHVLHMDGPENIPNEQILDAIEVLNRDYRKLNPDVNEVCCGFDTIAADVRLQFKLATIDPLGHCTNGIDRIRTVETFVGDNGSKLNWWPRDKYLNIWTCARMQDGVAGYSQYPSDVEGPNAPHDGVIILHDYIGRNNPDWTGNEGRSRALTHEVGHYLNLQHVWGNNNGEGNPPAGHMSPDCGDDGVEDTPRTRGWNYCPSPASAGDCNDTIQENFENYMEYSYCSKMFTEGQDLRMRAALESSLGERNSLHTTTNLAATGVDGVTDQHCAPIADFYCFTDAVPGSGTLGTPQGTRYYCMGDEVRFLDNSHLASASSWQWTFQDGEPATSTERNPEVSFTTGGGWKTVSLTVSNDQGSSTKVDEFSVFISDPWSWIPGVIHEDFEANCADCPWFMENYENDEASWTRATNAGHSGSSSMRLNAFDTYGITDYFIDDGANDIDALITPTMDLTWLEDGQLTFWYSCATKAANMDLVTERLEVWSSANCGRTWQLRATLDTSNLVTGGATPEFFVPPAGSASWHQAAIDLNSQLYTDHVRFKFVYYSSENSNNLYIDDVNVTGTAVGFPEVSGSAPGLSLVPNPTDGGLDVTYTLPGEGAGQLMLVDAQGRMVWSRATRNLASERIRLDARALGLAPGIYTMRLAHELGQRVERLMVR